jgi:glycosyltransferase involved in cell wall biosynthesis
MKLTAACITYKRPAQLGNAIACFLKQTHAEKELVILDDSPEPLDLQPTYPNVRYVHTKYRFRTIGEKRNACAALASPDSEGYCVWDDDDAYLPWHMSHCAGELATSDLYVPHYVYVQKNDPFRLVKRETNGLFHGSWAYSRAVFDAVRGYPHIQSGQDQAFLKLLKLLKGCTQSKTVWCEPSYAYSWFTFRGAWHLSAAPGMYERIGQSRTLGRLEVRETHDWEALHVAAEAARG